MNMDNYVWTGINACQYLGVLVQVDTVFKWIQLGLAIICSGVLLAYRIWKWHKDASKDGEYLSPFKASGPLKTIRSSSLIPYVSVI